MNRHSSLCLGLVLLGFSLLLSACGGASARESGYEWVQSWGGFGQEPGQFNDPIGIAIAGEEVFVADARNARIQVFDFDGRFLRQFGNREQLGRPMHLAIAQGKLYVADYWNDRIALFTLDGRWQGSLGRAGRAAGEFSTPSGVAVDDQGRLYVAEFHGQRVQLLDPQGKPLRQWGTGEKGLWYGRFNYPSDVALDTRGYLYVADAYNDRIQVFDSNGEFSHAWGGPFALNIAGGFDGWFRTAISVTVGPQDRVYVSDFLNHRIQIFTPQGELLDLFGEHGAGDGQFERPIDVAVAPTGELFVVDFGNHRIQKWRPKATRTGH